MKKFWTILTATTALMITTQAVGQSTLVEWNFNTPTASTGKEVTFNSTTNNLNLATSTLYRGNGAIPKGGCANAFVGEFTYSATLQEAIEKEAYFEVKLFSQENTFMSLYSIDCLIRAQTYAPRYYQWMYAINGADFEVIGNPVLISESDVNNKANSSVNNSGVAQPTVSLEGIEALQNMTSDQFLTFRLYAWGALRPEEGAEDTDYVNFGIGKSTSSAASLVIKGKACNNAYPLAWSFYGSKGTEVNYPATSANFNLNIPTLTRGAGAQSGGGNANGFSGTWAISSNLSEAQANDAYYEFEVKTRNNATISFNSIDVIFRAQTYSAKTYQWLYKVDDGAFIPIGSPVTIAEEEVHREDNTGANSGYAQPTVSLAEIADLQGVAPSSSVTFRLYAWGGSTPASDATDKTYIHFGFGKSSTKESAPALIIDATIDGGATIKEERLLAGWYLGGLAGITYGDVEATTNSTELTPSYLSRGPGLAAGSLNGSFVAKDTLMLTDEASAIDHHAYFELKVEPKEGQKIFFSRLLYKFRRPNANGPTNYSWRYSVDGSTFNPVASGTITSIDGNGVLMDPVNLSGITEMQGVASSVALRMYVWGAKSNNVVMGFGRTASGDASDIIRLYGSTSISTRLEESSLVNGVLRVIAGESIGIYSRQSENQRAMVKVIDLTGRTLYRQAVELLAGENTINLPINLQKGIYIASLEYANGKADHLKFAK